MGLSPEFAKALVAAQKDMPAVEPDGENPHFKSKFVTLGTLIAKVRPVLNRHGIAFAQFPSADEHGPTLVTVLTHEKGEQVQFAAPLILPKNDPQGQGSAITYMRRYALAAALGISAQEDDDGNAASNGAEPLAPRKVLAMSAKQRGFLENLLKEELDSAQDVMLVMDWAGQVLIGGRNGSGSEAIDGLKKNPEETAARLLAAAQKWQAGQTALPVDETDLPPVA